MSGSKSDYLELAILDHVLGGPDFTRPATVYIALFTVAPSDSGGGTEVTGGSYVRKAVTNNATNFPAASAGQKSNGVAIAFVTATASWGEVVAAAVMDAASAGNMLYYGELLGAELPFVGKSADEFLIVPGHTFSNGDIVKVSAIIDGALPTGLSGGTKYYVVGVSTDTLQLSLTLGGSAINITADGTGKIGLNKSKTIDTDDTASFAIGTLIFREA